MFSTLATKHIIKSDGERLKLLVDATTGLPLYYPNLYITSRVRGHGRSVATIQSFIVSMKVLYAWCEDQSIDIEDRWIRGEWLHVWEIDSLRDFSSRSLKLASEPSNNVVELSKGKGRDGVESSTKYIRMTFIAEYLKWLAVVSVHGKLSDTQTNDMLSMYRMIKAHRPKRTGRSNIDRDEKGLDPELIDEILEVLKPGHEKNPYKEFDLQVRNALIISLLRYLGIRRGELLNLKVDDVDFLKNDVHIIRRPDSSQDQRIYQPLVKTRQRILPINDKLAERLCNYVTKIRSAYPRARKHPYLFVTHKEGPHQGKPLSNSGFGKLLTSLQGVADSFTGVHAHAFRHSWNYNFSVLLDTSSDDTSPAREEQMRSYLMGWKETSGTAAVYNKRHIKEKAKEAALNFQRSLDKGKDSSDAK